MRPTEKSLFAPVSLQKFSCDLSKVFLDRGVQPKDILRFKKNYSHFLEKWGFKDFGGVALFPDLPLPVSAGIDTYNVKESYGMSG